VLALIASHPRVALVVLSYSYVISAFVVLAYTRLRRHRNPSVIPDPDSPHLNRKTES